MRKGKYAGNRRTFGGKQVALLLAVVLMLGCAAGGTLAWLLDTSEEVTNTFTTSTIGVELAETTTAYQMIPGWTIAKDPKVTVTANSEDCYLFVKIEKSANFDSYMSYAIESGWTQGNDTNKVPTDVYFREVTQNTSAQDFTILAAGTATDTMGTPNNTEDDVSYSWAANQVCVKPSVTKTMMTTANTNQPTMSFTAYASQLWKSNNPGAGASEAAIAAAKFTPAQAWANLNPGT